MSEWREVPLGKLLEVKYGKDHKKLGCGIIPVYGSGGIMRTGDTFLYDKPSVLIPRKGTLSNIFYVDRPFWTVDTMFWTKIDTAKVFPKFLYYAIKDNKWDSLNVGSAVPSLTVPVIEGVTISLPSLEVQERISAFLSSLDDKIANNRCICENLEAQAQALFKHWFIDFAPFKNGKFIESELGMIPEGWRVGTLGEIAEVSSGKRPQKRYDTQTEEHNVPLIGASCVMGYTREVFTSGKILLTGRVGTLGVVQRFNSNCWPSDNTLVLTTKFYEFLYQTLKTLNYSGMNRGTSQPLITQGDLKKVPIIIAPDIILLGFEKIASEMMSYSEYSLKESSRLATLRDTLLPKLMSGQI